MKTLLLGRVVLMEITQGEWSEVSLTREVAKVFGKAADQLTEEKNQSSLSSKGGV